MEAVLQRLDRLTREEAQTTAIRTLELVYSLVKNIKVVMDGAHGFLLVFHAVLIVGFPYRGKRIDGWRPSNPRYVLLIGRLVTINNTTSGHPAATGRHKQIKTCVQMLLR